MNEAMVYLSAVGFALAIFPVHFYNYIYINTENKYAGLNVTIYRFIKFYNANTVENNPAKMQVNGKSKKFDIQQAKKTAYKVFNKLCIFKVVQLGDFGLVKQNNAYFVLAQNALTTEIYKFIQINGGYAKLRNYTILNHEHEFIRYYCKVVTIMNSLVVGKILLILLWGKLNALKNQEK